MNTTRNMLLGALALSISIASADASVAVAPPGTVTPAGDVAGYSLSANPTVTSLPSGQSQGLLSDVGFSVSGPFTFASGLTTASIHYTFSESIHLFAGVYETSTHLSADIFDSLAPIATGYLQDFQVTTQLFSDEALQIVVANSYSAGGQTGFPSDFCMLSNCIGISSGSTSSLFFGGPFTVTEGTYYLQQTMIATITGEDPNDVVSIHIPNTSGVGTPTPEPGFFGLMALGLGGLAFVRRLKRTQVS